MEIDCLGEVIVLAVRIASTVFSPFVVQECLLTRVKTYPISFHVSSCVGIDIREGESRGSTVLRVAANIRGKTRWPETVEIEIFGVEVSHVSRSTSICLADSARPFSLESEISIAALCITGYFIGNLISKEFA